MPRKLVPNDEFVEEPNLPPVEEADVEALFAPPPVDPEDVGEEVSAPPQEPTTDPSIQIEEFMESEVPEGEGIPLHYLADTLPSLESNGPGVLQPTGMKNKRGERLFDTTVSALIFSAYLEPHRRTVQSGYSSASRTGEDTVRLSLYDPSHGGCTHFNITLPAMLVMSSEVID